MAAQVFLETPRLRLRPYAPGDGPLLVEIAQKNRAHLQRYESGNMILAAHSEAEAEKIIVEMGAAWEQGDYLFLGAFEHEGGEFACQIYVGIVSRELPEFEIGYFADCDHEGQGFVSEAAQAVVQWIFQELGAHRVSLRCSDANRRSARVAERCGFVLEGHLRETRRDPQGIYSGDLCYGVLRREFLV